MTVKVRFSAPVQTSLGAQPAPCTMSTGSISQGYSSWGVTTIPLPLWKPTSFGWVYGGVYSSAHVCRMLQAEILASVDGMFRPHRVSYITLVLCLTDLCDFYVL
jgi:hypothetical protein